MSPRSPWPLATFVFAERLRSAASDLPTSAVFPKVPPAFGRTQRLSPFFGSITSRLLPALFLVGISHSPECSTMFRAPRPGLIFKFAGLAIFAPNAPAQILGPLNSTSSHSSWSQLIFANRSALKGSSDLQPAESNSGVDPSRCLHLKQKFMTTIAANSMHSALPRMIIFTQPAPPIRCQSTQPLP
jgi:hypothetical protein